MLVSKYIISTVFWHLNLEMHQPHESHLLSAFTSADDVIFTFYAILCPSKHILYIFYYFETCNTLSVTLFVVSLPLNRLYLLFFAVQLVIGCEGSMMSSFNIKKHHWYFTFIFVTSDDVFLMISLRFLNPKWINSIMRFHWQSGNTQLLPLRKHFNI